MSTIWHIRYLLTTVLFSLLVVAVLAKPVEISGLLPGAEKFEIRLIKFSDRISYRTEILDRILVSDSATFVLKCDVNDPTQLLIDVDFYSAYLYVIPGMDYHLNFDAVDIAYQYRPFYRKDKMLYSITNEPAPQINAQINAFEKQRN